MDNLTISSLSPPPMELAVDVDMPDEPESAPSKASTPVSALLSTYMMPADRPKSFSPYFIRYSF